MSKIAPVSTSHAVSQSAVTSRSSVSKNAQQIKKIDLIAKKMLKTFDKLVKRAHSDDRKFFKIVRSELRTKILRQGVRRFSFEIEIDKIKKLKGDRTELQNQMLFSGQASNPVYLYMLKQKDELISVCEKKLLLWIQVETQEVISQAVSETSMFAREQHEMHDKKAKALLNSLVKQYTHFSKALLEELVPWREFCK